MSKLTRVALLGLALLCVASLHASGVPSSLLFVTGSSSANQVDCGSGASLDNMATGTVLAWVYPTDVAALHRIFNKFQTQRISFSVANGASGNFIFGYNRSTTNLTITSPGSLVTTGEWQVLGATWDASATNTDQHLYRGTLTTPIAEIASYTTQQVGSGTHTDGTGTFNVGWDGTLTGHWYGSMARLDMWNRVLTSDERAGQQFRPRPLSGSVLSVWMAKNGLGTIYDESGQANHCTISGATPSNLNLPFVHMFPDED